MFEVRRTEAFIVWLSALRDIQARARIAKRIDRIAQGNLGDARSVGEGVSELRFASGPGYRVYFTMRAGVVVILLCDGDKSLQARDIERATAMAREI